MSTPPTDDWYTPDPRDAEPSRVPGLSVGEYAEIAEKILWFSRLTISQKIRAWDQDMRLAARLQRFRTPTDGT